MMQKQIYRLMLVACCSISSLASAKYYTTYKTVDHSAKLPNLPTVAVYPYAVQPSASIGYQGSKAHIGIQIPLGQRVYLQSAYQLPTLPSYQQIEQIHLPYGGTYTKKTEVIPQTPVYLQPQVVLPITQRVVISQGTYYSR